MRLPILSFTTIALLFTGAAEAHDWYADLWSDSGIKCCGRNDCAPYPYRTTPGEMQYELFIMGKWWPVPTEAILGMFSPDGLAHACCYYGYAKVGCEVQEPVSFRCVILPGQGV